MAAATKFIWAAVGAKATNRGHDVRGVQQLLLAAGYAVKGGADGRWGDGTRIAIAQARGDLDPDRRAGDDVLQPGDPLLTFLARKADILIEMPGKAGLPGVQALHQAFVDNDIQYNDGAQRSQGNRATYGLDGELDLAVQTIEQGYHRGPVQMDCTTYVNLMLSVFANGHCHYPPYDASCADFGMTQSTHCARDRYQMPLVARTVTTTQGAKSERRYFLGADEISDTVAATPGRLYALERAMLGSGAVTHMALLVDGTVYQCTNVHPSSSASCISGTLDEFCRHFKNSMFYLFGPNLATR